MHTPLRSLRAAILISLALAAALLSAGCGGDDPKATLDKAFSTPIKSANVTLNAEAKVNGSGALSQPVKFTLTGPYQSNGQNKIPSFKWALSLGGGGQTLQAGIASTGDNAFVSFQGSDYEIGQQEIARVNQQIAQGTKTKGTRSLKDFGINPKDWVTSEDNKGDEKVAGVDTTHISAGLDVKALFRDLNKTIDKAGTAAGSATGRTPTKLTDQQINQIAQIVKDPKFDVYVAKDDHTVRRIAVALNFQVPQANQQQAAGASSGNLTFSIEFADVGKPQTITAPANPKPISQLQKDTKALTGALGSLGGSTTK
ncbi:MAG: hypothetical protein QOE08_2448 [Thermoleophilaceae bacterium]|nr:hypothetical protein [Thermoleophilaceae bacterium]